MVKIIVVWRLWYTTQFMPRKKRTLQEIMNDIVLRDDEELSTSIVEYE
jgi:hypothetical protein